MRFSVKVTPNSKRQEIIKEPDGSLRVYLKSSVKKGKANKELIEVLANYFDVPKIKIIIRIGGKSRNKIIEIEKT